MTTKRQEMSTRVALQQAQKSAEALFETRSIANIKEVRTLATSCALAEDSLGALV